MVKISNLMLFEKRKIFVEGEEHLVNIYVERRNSVRASILRSGVNIRIPRHLLKYKREEEIEKLISWVKNKLNGPEKVHVKKNYANGSYLSTNSKIYEIHIEIRDSIKNFSKLVENKIIFKISKNYNERQRQEYISKQLRKILAKNHLSELKYHVNRLNNLHFRKEIKKIDYKYTISRWGACKTNKKEIYLSTRLLLAPFPVLEYVIIHELAHLIHANHSKEFWGLVKFVDPLFKQKSKWLKKNGKFLDI